MDCMLLNKSIKDSGYRKAFIAEKLDLSLQGFLNKCHGDSEFKVSEMLELINLLALDDAEAKKIFY